ncbi:hypothetical protein DERP_003298 [Dermatophagoides pteronyssinus]|uniref:Uncharacterized protein n=1 Tax=Dermatophagoides pteronyssinus TaxID=6956 RepID=A0ABQ8JJV5_DERPT|nr:hypothetical protein DERP_003298 [Dermatophagoides pteronyssinus]
MLNTLNNDHIIQIDEHLKCCSVTINQYLWNSGSSNLSMVDASYNNLVGYEKINPMVMRKFLRITFAITIFPMTLTQINDASDQ